MSQDDPQLSDADLLRTLLAGRDITCPVCAYNLRGIESMNCPECGAQLELRVGSSDLKLGPWLTALLGVALPLGFVSIYAVFGFVTVIAFVIAGGIGRPSAGEALAGMGVPALICAGYGLLLWRIVRRRRKFWARSRGAQWRSAVLYAVLGPGAILLPMIFLVLVSGVF
ncbi:MAG: hypothetical protein ACYSU7_01030 [Planctomycetota bacterium]|jgi:hypothetical protein